jgi:hypothetical protein
LFAECCNLRLRLAIPRRKLQCVHVSLSAEVEAAAASHHGPNPSDGDEQASLTPSDEHWCCYLSFKQFALFVFEHSLVTDLSSREDEVGDISSAKESTHGNSVQQSPQSAFTQDQGGLRGCTRTATTSDDSAEEILFLGIIDMLVPFKLRKKMEHVAKSIIQHGENFSVVPPSQYGERFSSFVCSCIVDDNL